MTVYTAFGLTREPFGPEPDAELFYPALGHEDCLERLRLTVALGLGLGIVTGEPGVGTSSVRAALLDEIAHHPGLTIVAIDEPAASRTDVLFLRRVMGALGLPGTGRTGLDLTTALLRELAARRERGAAVVLAIDDAGGLAGNQLDVLRALLAAETPPPLTVLLFGGPELGDRVARKRNLAQRAAMSHTLNPLNRRDTAGLVARRLSVAGLPAGAELFTGGAIDRLHLASGGVPGAIVRLAAAAMDAAVSAGTTTVDAALMARVAGGDQPALTAATGTSTAAAATTVVQTSFVAQLERLAEPEGHGQGEAGDPTRATGVVSRQASRTGQSGWSGPRSGPEGTGPTDIVVAIERAGTGRAAFVGRGGQERGSDNHSGPVPHTSRRMLVGGSGPFRAGHQSARGRSR